ncbi:MAG: InlB B-repeat-containing protein [Alphaproteobacteria bacterium]|nr:InlB B-repeat-containing protein [Alphaproteobacteria bacterium]
MKKILFLLFVVLPIRIGAADTVNINWMVGDSVYDTTTCTVGGDIILPTAPTKRGHTFLGWATIYTPIEYIESTGIQYIDTGELLNANSKIETKFSCNASGNYAVFGAGNGSAFNTGELSLFWSGSRLEVVRPTSNTGSDVLRPNNSVSSYVPQEVSYDRSVLTIDNSSYASNWYADYQGVNSMYIFGIHRTSSNKFIGDMRLYYFKLYENNALVRDFIPVLDSHGIPCMFDKVSKTFFYNAGTGDFVAGPVITE